MPNATTKTLGTTIKYGTAGGGAGITVATVLGGIAAIPAMPKLVFDEYENSHIDQTSLVKSFIMTLADAGTLAVTVAMAPATLTDLYALADGEARGWLITFKSGGKLHFDGPIKEVGPQAGGTNTEVLVPLVVRVTSKPIYAPPV